NASVAKNTVRNRLNMPFCAYWVQISTTFLLSSTDAFSTPSSRMFALMNSTAREAPVVTAWAEAPVNQCMTAPPVISPSRKGGCITDNLSMSCVSLLVSSTMIDKIIVVAPTTAVPISTGLAVALNVLPAPSFSSRLCLAFSKFTSNPYWLLSDALMPGISSICDSSNTDCALSVTGPYESTAIVTGPIPRKPNATRPTGYSAGAIRRRPSPWVLIMYATLMRPMMVMPSQYAEKLPATRPDRMLSD